jgi:dGTPase
MPVRVSLPSHGFRLLTRLQILNDDFGLNLTCGTLAALIKYPSFSSDTRDSSTYKKFGIFESERSIIETVWDQTGLGLGPEIRHPFAHIMEACDDIAYAVIDAEDIIKKQFASFNDLIAHLSSIASDDALTKRVIDNSVKKHDTYKLEGLSSNELNEISMQMFRVYAIYELVNAVTNKFVHDVTAMMNLEIPANYELIKESEGAKFAKSLKDFDYKHGFRHREVLELELRGHNHLIKTMDMMWAAIDQPKGPFNKFAYSSISENYRRIFEKNSENDETDKLYNKAQLLCDTISGMTDKHLIRVHNELSSLQPHG